MRVLEIKGRVEKSSYICEMGFTEAQVREKNGIDAIFE
jgi:hypothetical protein